MPHPYAEIQDSIEDRAHAAYTDMVRREADRLDPRPVEETNILAGLKEHGFLHTTAGAE